MSNSYMSKGLRRPSVDYNLLSLENKLEALKLEPLEEKERWTVYEEIKRLVDKYIADRAEKLPLNFKPTTLVGSMVDGTHAGMPEFDLELPVLFDSAQFTDPVFGRVTANLTSTVDKLTEERAEFLNEEGKEVSAEKVCKFVKNLVGTAVDYYKSMTGTFPKHKPDFKVDENPNRLTVRLQDKRSGDHTVSVHFLPMLHLYTKDGVLKKAVPDCNTDSWQLSFLDRETNMISGWEKDKTDLGCRKDCLRLLKALVISRYPELPSTLVKTVILREIVATKNSDNVWSHEEMSSRFVDLVKRLEEGLARKEVISFHAKQLGGDVNLIAEMKSDAMDKVYKRLAGDVTSSTNAILGLIKVSHTGKT